MAALRDACWGHSICADTTRQDMCGRRESTSTRENAIGGFPSGTTLLLLLLTS